MAPGQVAELWPRRNKLSRSMPDVDRVTVLEFDLTGRQGEASSMEVPGSATVEELLESCPHMPATASAERCRGFGASAMLGAAGMARCMDVGQQSA